MPAFLFLLAVMSAKAVPPAAPAHGVIEATIEGTTQPLDVVLLARDAEAWNEIDHRVLTPSTRFVRFETLKPGVYQVLVRGPKSTEQFATKFVIGGGDTRHATIVIDPVTVSGRVILGGSGAGPGTVSLRHKEFRWHAAFDVAADGSFRVPLWQRGTYIYAARAASMTTAYSATVDLAGVSPINFPIEIPDGRITGIVRDAKSGAAVGGASIALQSESAGSVQHLNVTTNEVGRFEFTGLRLGRQTVRIASPRYLEPSPIAFELDAATSGRALDIHLDPGKLTSVIVIDADGHPVANASVFAVTGARRRSRATTDENGSARLPVPITEAATLFAIPNEGAFAVMPLNRAGGEPVMLHLPRAGSSLRIRARTTSGQPMPPFSLLLRYDGEIMPLAISEELSAVQGLHFSTDEASEAYLPNIPSGRYEFWPYRTPEEAEAILETSREVTPPIQVDVRGGENTIVVKFAAR
jgi:hypothetical protein